MVEKKDVPLWLKIITTLVSLIAAIWVGGWSASQIYSTNSAVVVSLEKRTAATEAEVKDLDTRMDGIEKSFIKQELGQKTLIKGLDKISVQVEKQNDLLIKRIEVDARLEQWIKSNDTK